MPELQTIPTETLPDAGALPEPVTAPERCSRALLAAVGETESELDAYYTAMTEDPAPEKRAEEVQAQLRSYRQAAADSLRASQRLMEMCDELYARWRDLARSRKDRHLPIPPAPANAEIDLEENASRHFARGINGYKLLWICFIGSFAGVIIEMLWCLLTNGYLASRAGLVIGPFNLLYGVGAAALTAALYRFRNRGRWLSFLGGMLVGSVVEYVCSWAQELVFGSRSWDYSHLPFNLNGRICLLYSFFWGLLGVLWMKSLYPRMAQGILKLPNRAGRILTWVLTAFFLLDALITLLAVLRWSARLNGTASAGAVWELCDRLFPNEVLQKIFPNMVF